MAVGHEDANGNQVSLDREQIAPDVGVLTVDDQAVFRDLARLVLQTTPGFRSVGEAATGEDALALVAELGPDLVIVDVRMPGIGGIEAARRISAAHPDVVVVLISTEDPADLPSAAEDSGADALVRKQDFGAALLRDLWATHGTRKPRGD
jgi:two-component system, NarL family, invasion response regulator UvrY